MLGLTSRYGSLDVVVLNAGIGEQGDIFDPATPRHASEGGWQATLDIDLTAVITGLRCRAGLEGGCGIIVKCRSPNHFYLYCVVELK